MKREREERERERLDLCVSNVDEKLWEEAARVVQDICIVLRAAHTRAALARTPLRERV